LRSDVSLPNFEVIGGVGKKLFVQGKRIIIRATFFGHIFKERV